MARLLLVEDDPGYQELIPTILLGHEFSVCSSAEEARSRLQIRPFDMLILDIDLLGISWLQLLKELKAGGLTEKMPVVMCSSFFTPQQRQQAMDDGAAGYISKPFDAGLLRAMVQALLG